MHSLFLPTVGRFGDPFWQPAADVYRTRDGWLVKFDLAGVRPDEVTISTSGKRLTIRGCRRDWFAESESHRHYHMEISYSCFERSLDLPHPLELCELSTEYRDGMLLVHIPLEKAK
jgi:HSP20 family protein